MSGTVTVTADDFGLDVWVNESVDQLGRAGRLDAASLLVAAPAAEDALARRVPIAVGLHVELAADLLAAGSREQIVTAIEDQVRWMTERDCPPAHLDLHTLALYGLGPDAARPGGVVPEAIEVAARHGLRLRLPRHLPAALGRAPGHDALVALADQAGVAIPDAIVSDFRPAQDVRGGDDLRRHYAEAMASRPRGHTEVFCHPAIARDHYDGPEPAAMRRKRHYEHALLAETRHLSQLG